MVTVKDKLASAKAPRAGERSPEHSCLKEQLAAILAPHRGQRRALIPVLQQVQGQLGYLPSEALVEVAQSLRVPAAEIYSLVTFHPFFRLSPVGKNLVRVCRGAACHVKGGKQVRQELEKQLGIKPGETSPDLEYTLEEVTCLGACAIAPAMVINRDTYGELTPRKVADIIAQQRGEA